MVRAYTRGQVRQQKARFLAAFERSGIVAAAAAACGINRTSIYGWKQTDPVFAAALAEAEEASTQALEEVGLKRAVDGSDLLMMFFLKARRPNVYRDRYTVDASVVLSAPAILLPEETYPDIDNGQAREDGLSPSVKPALTEAPPLPPLPPTGGHYGAGNPPLASSPSKRASG